MYEFRWTRKVKSFHYCETGLNSLSLYLSICFTFHWASHSHSSFKCIRLLCKIAEALLSFHSCVLMILFFLLCYSVLYYTMLYCKPFIIFPFHSVRPCGIFRQFCALVPDKNVFISTLRGKKCEQARESAFRVE
jgi:hypothetical protein